MTREFRHFLFKVENSKVSIWGCRRHTASPLLYLLLGFLLPVRQREKK